MNVMKVSRIIAPLLIVAVLTAACGKTPPPARPPQPAPAGSSPVVQSPGLPADVVETTWEWERLVTPVETVTPDRPDRYTVRFERTGRVQVRADCNRGGGPYTITSDRRISLGPIALTRVACPAGSLGDRFTRDLQRVTIYFVRDGAFFLEMPVDSGTFHFRRER